MGKSHRNVLLIFTTALLLAIACAQSSSPPPSVTPPIPTSTSTPEPREPVGKWRTEFETSAFDDSQTVILRLRAEQPVQGWLVTYTPSLILRCMEGSIEAYVHIGMQADVEYGLTDLATVRLRYGQSPAFTVRAHESTDGEALFFPDAQAEISRMLNHQSLVFGFTPFNAPPVSTSFDLGGLPAAIAPLNDACAYSYVSPLRTAQPLTAEPVIATPTAPALTSTVDPGQAVAPPTSAKVTSSPTPETCTSVRVAYIPSSSYRSFEVTNYGSQTVTVTAVTVSWAGAGTLEELLFGGMLIRTLSPPATPVAIIGEFDGTVAARQLDPGQSKTFDLGIPGQILATTITIVFDDGACLTTTMTQ